MFSGGVNHPLTHVAEATPDVGGGTFGMAGGVGELVGASEVTGVFGGVVGANVDGGGLP